MSALSNFVSLHPYFKVHEGKLEDFIAGFPVFAELTKTERKNLFYEFSVNGNEVFCREAYVDAQGLLTHLDNVGALLTHAMKTADLIRVEVHGPARELDKLRRPLAHLKPECLSWLKGRQGCARARPAREKRIKKWKIPGAVSRMDDDAFPASIFVG